MTPSATTTDTGRGRGRRRQGSDDQQRQQSSALTVIRAKDPKDAVGQVDYYIGRQEQSLRAMFALNPHAFEQLRALTRLALSKPALADKLARADLATAVQAVSDCAALGLMPIAATAQAYFVPFWNKEKGLYDIVLIPGYRGLMHLIVDGQRVINLEAFVVYEKDHFVERYGTQRMVEFVPLRVGDRGARIGALSIASIPHPRGGVEAFHHFMDMAQIEKVRKSSRAADKGPWVDWYDEMAIKTVIRHHGKTLPLTPLAERALGMESTAEERHAPPPVAGGSSTAIPAFDQVKEGLGLPTGRATWEAEAGQEVERPADGDVTEAVDGEVREVPPDATPATAASGPPPARRQAGSLATSHPDAEPPDDGQPQLFEGS